MHLLPAPDLAKQINKEPDENLEVHEKKPGLKSQGKVASSHPRRRNYPREHQTLRKTRKRRKSKMLTPWKSFNPTKLLRKAKMMLLSVQSR